MRRFLRCRRRRRQPGQREQEHEQFLEQLIKEVSALETEISQGQSGLITLINQRSTTKTNLQRYETMLEQTQIRKAELTGRLLTAKGEEEDLSKNRAELQVEYDETQAVIERMIADNSVVEQNIQRMQEALAVRSRELEEAKTAYHREASRLESLRNITERYDGYGISIRKVMEQKSVQSGLHGVVADLIRTQKKYETAIETALGGSIRTLSRTMRRRQRA